mmetsp:Transcript_11380/g.35526  ORF Transcript_11380/g.35526 Transcript_11380/m.35526 type:complete len:241 (+) Transcript_11380:647-1369(+)
MPHDFRLGLGVERLPVLDAVLPQLLAIASALWDFHVEMSVGHRQDLGEDGVHIVEARNLRLQRGPVAEEDDQPESPHDDCAHTPRPSATRQGQFAFWRCSVQWRDELLRKLVEALHAPAHDRDGNEADRPFREARADLDRRLVPRRDNVVNEHKRESPDVAHDPRSCGQLQKLHCSPDAVQLAPWAALELRERAEAQEHEPQRHQEDHRDGREVAEQPAPLPEALPELEHRWLTLLDRNA